MNYPENKETQLAKQAILGLNFDEDIGPGIEYIKLFERSNPFADKLIERAIRLGYSGAPENTDSLRAFLLNLLQDEPGIINEHNIRAWKNNLRNWLVPPKNASAPMMPKSREVVYQICFALHMNMYEAAIHYCSEALSLWKCLYGDNHPHIANAYANLGVLYRECAMYDESITVLTTAIRLLEQIHGAGSINPDFGTAYSALGKTYAEFGSKELAEVCYQKALDIRLKLFNPDHPSVRLVQQRIRELSTTPN